LHGTLLRHYLAPLAQERQAYEFYHESDIGLNAVREFARRTFERPERFIEQTHSIAKHLYSVSNHPSIAGGEVITILYRDVRVEQQPRFAIGIYKIEERESFLDVVEERGRLNLVEYRGIPVRIQKGVLILEGAEEVFSKEAGSSVAQYWAESFLKVRPARTPVASAKAAATLLKEVNERIDVESRLSLRHDFEQLVSDGDSLSFGSIREVGDQYLGEGGTAEILGALEARNGFSIPDDYPIEAAVLKRQARAVSREFNIMDGVSLLVANGKVRLQACGLQRTKKGARITIDLDMGGE
jgi:hypothetical protein